MQNCTLLQVGCGRRRQPSAAVAKQAAPVVEQTTAVVEQATAAAKQTAAGVEQANAIEIQVNWGTASCGP